MGQVCRLTRIREIRGKQSEEIVYAITSLAKEKASAENILRLSRAHWGIENRLHFVRDMTFREDQCRVRKGAAPQVLAACRNTARTILKRFGFNNIAAGLRYFMMNYPQACHLVRYGIIE